MATIWNDRRKKSAHQLKTFQFQFILTQFILNQKPGLWNCPLQFTFDRPAVGITYLICVNKKGSTALANILELLK